MNTITVTRVCGHVTHEPRDLGPDARRLSWLAGMPCARCRRHLPALTGSVEEVHTATPLREWAMFREGAIHIHRTEAAWWIE